MTITYLGYEDKIVNVSIINGKSTELNVSITQGHLW